MMAAKYGYKKDLKAAVGRPIRYIETSMFAAEYKENGRFCVVGPSPTQRKWYAEVWMKDGLIERVE